MGDWKERPLGEILKLTKGISYKSSDYGTEDEGVTFINLKCIAKSGGFSRRGVKYYKGYVPENLKLKEGDVIIANTDLTRNGDIVGCPLILPNLQSDEVTMSMDLSRLDIISNEVDEKFVYYALMTSSARKFMKENSSGSTVLHLKTSKVPTYKILMPLKKGEQSTIATILTTIDQAIEKTEQLIAKYERIKTGLMQDLLARGIDDQGNIRIEETHEFKDSPLGRIPREWEVGSVKDYLSYISYGFTNPMPTTETGPVMISATNIFDGKIQYETCRLTSQKDFDSVLTPKSKPKIGDVLMTKDGTLGRLAIADRENICITQSVAIMRTRPEKIDTKFFKILLESPNYQKVIFDESGGSTIKHVYITKLAKMQIALPQTVNEQVRILDCLSKITDSIGELYKQLSNHKSTKTGLMQDLLTGKVRVDTLFMDAQQGTFTS